MHTCILALSGIAALVGNATGEVVFENPRIRASVGEDAVWRSLVDKTTGQGLLRRRQARAVCRRARRRQDPQGKSGLAGRTTSYRSASPAATRELVYAVSTTDDWIAFQLAEVTGTRPSHVTLLSIGVTITERGGSRLGAAWNDDYAVCLRGTNLQTHGSRSRRSDHTAAHGHHAGLPRAEAGRGGRRADRLRRPTS